MLIPKISVVVMHQGRRVVLRGSIDTGADGIGIILPSVAQRLGLPIVEKKRVVTFGNRVDELPVFRVDYLGLNDAPECYITNADLVGTEIPGGEEILLGERFFSRFHFVISYEAGRPKVACQGDWLASIGNFAWTIPPAVVIGGFLFLGLIVGELFAGQKR